MRFFYSLIILNTLLLFVETSKNWVFFYILDPKTIATMKDMCILETCKFPHCLVNYRIEGAMKIEL